MKKPATAISTLSITAPQKEQLMRRPMSLRQSRRGIDQCASALPSGQNQWNADNRSDDQNSSRRLVAGAWRNEPPDIFHFIAAEAFVLSLALDHYFRVRNANKFP